MPDQESPNLHYSFLAGGGEMGRLMRTKDWTTSSIGTPDSWPQSLRTTLSIILHSRFPMFLFWGQDHLCFYNDAYRPSLGVEGKHPQSLGKKGVEVWPEIWPQIHPLIEQVMSGGEATWAEDQLLPIQRNGTLEDVYWTFSYSPVTDETGHIAGVFVTCSETTEKVVNHHTLLESRDQLQFAIEAGDLATWDIDPVTNKFTSSPKLSEWHGLPEGNEFTLETGYSRVRPGDRMKLEVAIQQALKPDSDGQLDVKYTIRNPLTGRARVVRAKGKTTFDHNKQPIHLNGILQDVTEQVRALEKVEENEYRLRTLIEGSVIAMGLYMGKELKIQYANDALLGFFGKKQTILGMPLAEAVPELKGQPFLSILDNVFTTGEEYTGKEEAAHLEINGILQTFYFDYTYKALRNKDGSIFGIHHTALDVTERVLAGKALKASEERFRHTVEQAPLGITILRGPDFLVEMANPGYLQIVNNTEEKFVGKKLFNVLPQVRASIEGILNEVLKTGVPYHGYEFPAYINRDGQDVLTHFNFVYQPLREKDGTIGGIIVVATDVSASVKAKHDLAESERQFRNMVVQSPIPMTILRGKDYIIETANIAMFKEVWRKKEEDVIGRSILKVFPELMDQKYPDLLKEVFTSGKMHTEIESIAYVKGDDGMRKFYLDFEYAPLLDPDQTISGIIITVNDVTEKVEARLKAEESEQKLNLVIDASEFGTWEWNMQTDDMSYNDRFLRMFGFNESANVTHDQFLKRLHPDDMPIRAKAFSAAYQTGVLHYETRIIWSNGIQRWIEVRGKVFMNEDGSPISLIGTTRDTTDERFYQRELEDRERKFRLLADSMPQMVWTGNAYGDLNYFNQSVYSYSGLSKREIAEQGWLQIVHPDDKAANMEAWQHAIDTGSDFIFEHRFRRADGQYRWQLSRAIPQRDDLGNIRMWVGTSTDIQEMKELDEQKDLFIGMASHELKTPVTTVKGYVQLLQDMYAHVEDDVLKHSLDRMHRQIVTLTDLISDLLDLSKIKSGSLHFNKENFDLEEMTRDIIHNTKGVNPVHTIELASSGEMLVHADKNRISQVLINFLTNAIKYSPQSRLIKVKIEKREGTAYVAVQDQGIGISQADQEKIFQRFYRVEGRNETTFPGFGIGLFISSEIIKKHSGTIGVNSQEGVGSTFYFSIPILNP